LNDSYTRQLRRFNDCHDQSFPIPSYYGSGYYRSVCPCKGILLFLEEYRLQREMSVAAELMPPILGFSYCISGQVRWSINGVIHCFVTRRGHCELIMTGLANGGSSCYGIDEPLIMMNIMIDPRLLKRFFDVSMEGIRFEDMLHPLATGNEVRYQKRTITGVERQVVGRLLRTPCQRPADRLFIQSKVMELAAFQLDLMDTPAAATAPPRESTADMALVSQAKSILESRLQSPPSLKRLARMLGTNETRLKKSFVSCCGTTVYGYLTACRMQRACELLGNNGLTLSQIGSELGYSERTHFTRAFTRHFGMPPSRYRRKLERLPSR
jgi:AraC-like DNA-binding protein